MSLIRRKRRLRILLRIARILVSVFSSGTCLAWARNGHAVGYATDISSLDVTLYSSEGKPPSLWVLRIARLFGRFGKWSFRQRPDRWVIDAANLFELGRDPLLWKALVRKARTPTPAEALVYWMRLKDEDQWLSSKSMADVAHRQAKWEYHQRAIQRGLKDATSFTFPGLIDQMERHLLRLTGAPYLGQEAFLRPHRWIENSENLTPSKKPILAGGPEAWLAIARAQVQWEFWEMLGQVRLKQNFEECRHRFVTLVDLFAENDPIRLDAKKYLEYFDAIAT